MKRVVTGLGLVLLTSNLLAQGACERLFQVQRILGRVAVLEEGEGNTYGTNIYSMELISGESVCSCDSSRAITIFEIGISSDHFSSRYCYSVIGGPLVEINSDSYEELMKSVFSIMENQAIETSVRLKYYHALARSFFQGD